MSLKKSQQPNIWPQNFRGDVCLPELQRLLNAF